MRVNVFAIALQVLDAVDAVTNLQPGESRPLPVVHISDHGEHVDIAVTISKDAQTSKASTPSVISQSNEKH
jgi:hypothetical protein